MFLGTRVADDERKWPQKREAQKRGDVTLLSRCDPVGGNMSPWRWALRSYMVNLHPVI